MEKPYIYKRCPTTYILFDVELNLSMENSIIIVDVACQIINPFAMVLTLVLNLSHWNSLLGIKPTPPSVSVSTTTQIQVHTAMVAIPI